VLVWATPLQKSPLKKVSAKDIDSRIFNGTRAGVGQFPWQAALYVHAEPPLFCSGSIISEEWILTAAQCLVGAESATVLAGFMDLSNQGQVIAQVAESSEVILHQDYDPDAFDNDIALIKLQTPLTFNVDVVPIALAEDFLENGIDVRVSGWGASSDADSSLSRFLSYVDLVAIRNSDCIAIYGNVIVDSMVCAQARAMLKGACLGDGGSPLVVNADISPVLVGLVNFISPNGCESGYPTGFTRIASYRNWIRDNSGV
jgi:secreted trypsin-like serine protease